MSTPNAEAIRGMGGPASGGIDFSGGLLRLKPMNRCLAILCGCVLATLCGCRSPHAIRIAADPKGDPSRYQTFGLLPVAGEFSASHPDLLLRAAKTATNTVVRVLQQKGYQPAPPQGADFVVYLRGKLVPSRDVTELGYLPAFGRMGWAKPYPYAYGYTLQDETLFRENVLIIEVYDNTTRKMAWVGWTQLPDKIRPATEAVEVMEAVQRILARFPNRAAPSKAEGS